MTPMIREIGDNVLGVRLVLIVAISRMDMCKITEITEAWLADPANNVIYPGSEGVAFAKPLVGFAAAEDDLAPVWPARDVVPQGLYPR